MNYEWAFAATCFNLKDIPSIQKGDISNWGYANRAAATYPNEIIRLIKLLSKYDKSQIRMRTEGRGLSLFFKDINILDDLKTVSNDAVTELWKPVSDEALEYMKVNRRVVVKKQLTHGCRYKVALNGPINKISPDSKKNFVNLIERNPEEFYISDQLLKDFKSEHRYFWGNYFYVKDSKFLLMTQMILQPVIKEVVKIVTHDEVNQEEVANV